LNSRKQRIQAKKRVSNKKKKREPALENEERNGPVGSQETGVGGLSHTGSGGGGWREKETLSPKSGAAVVWTSEGDINRGGDGRREIS